MQHKTMPCMSVTLEALMARQLGRATHINHGADTYLRRRQKLLTCEQR